MPTMLTHMGGCLRDVLSASLELTPRGPRLIYVTPSAAGKYVTLPDAQELHTGGPWIVANGGSESVEVEDKDLDPVVVLAASEAAIIYLADNTTQAGVWRAMTRTILRTVS